MICATIDVGTNTTLLLVVRLEPGRPPVVLADRAEITRLGRGIGKDGLLGREGMDRTLEVLRGYAAEAATHGARPVAVGTEALRRAANAGEFLRPAAAILGAPVEVVDGEREATLTFRAVAASFPAVAAGLVTVVDIGGGSTEIVMAEDGRVTTRKSVPLGSVRLTEEHITADPPTAAMLGRLGDAIARVADTVTFQRGATLVGVAGTVTTLAAMAQGLETYDPGAVHGFRLPRAALEAQIARLVAARQAERERMAGLDPRRADVILAGSLILRCLVERAGAAEILVSDHGIRWGLAHELAGQGG